MRSGSALPSAPKRRYRRTSSGSLAMLAAMGGASSRVSRFGCGSELALARRSVSGRRWIGFGATAKRPVVCHRGRLNQRNVLIGKSVTKRIEHTSRDDVQPLNLCFWHGRAPQLERRPEAK